jgi:hypothetical protein
VRAAELGEVGGHDHLVPVAGHHDEPAIVQGAHAARDALGEHRDAPDPPGQVAFAEDLGVQLPYQVTHPRPGQLGAVRHPRDEAEPAPGQLRGQLLDGPGFGRGQAVDHAADHAPLLAGGVTAGRDGQLPGQRFDGVIWRPLADQQDLGIQ